MSSFLTQHYICPAGTPTAAADAPDNAFLSIYAPCAGGGELPVYEYTGEHRFEDEGGGNWKLYLLTSGNITFSNQPGPIDVFCVGGGGAGNNALASGGGGGYTTTAFGIEIDPDSAYPVVVGAGAQTRSGTQPPPGGASSAFGVSAQGGKSGKQEGGGHGGDGGSGGAPGGGDNRGGSDGGDGLYTGATHDGIPGRGQGSTTREFGAPDGILYSGGGGSWDHGLGGEGGGGNYKNPGTPNTGGGGGGQADGGSGVVVLRNSRS